MSKQYKLTVNGKVRIIRDIQERSDALFYAFYRGYIIHAEMDDKGRSYAWCTHPDGCHIVDGYVGGGSLEGAIQVCMDNIFHGEAESEVKG